MASSFFAPFVRPDIQIFFDTLAAIRHIADIPDFVEETRGFLLERIELALGGSLPAGDQEPTVFTLAALRLLRIQAQGRLDPQWALRLVQAARRDISRPVCATWPDLLLYCRYAAEPIGRAILQLHHLEQPELQRSTDALCASLLLLRLTRRCGQDWRLHGRCYLPTDWFTEAGGTPEQLVERKSSPAVRAVIQRVLDRTEQLLHVARDLPQQLADPRMVGEATRLLYLANYQLSQLRQHDPLRRYLRTSRRARILAHFRGWLAARRR